MPAVREPSDTCPGPVVLEGNPAVPDIEFDRGTPVADLAAAAAVQDTPAVAEDKFVAPDKAVDQDRAAVRDKAVADQDRAAAGPIAEDLAAGPEKFGLDKGFVPDTRVVPEMWVAPAKVFVRIGPDIVARIVADIAVGTAGRIAVVAADWGRPPRGAVPGLRR